MSSTSPEKALFSISKTLQDKDEICITIIKNNTHIRLSLSPQNFTETLFGGNKVDANIIRWQVK